MFFMHILTVLNNLGFQLDTFFVQKQKTSVMIFHIHLIENVTGSNTHP